MHIQGDMLGSEAEEAGGFLAAFSTLMLVIVERELPCCLSTSVQLAIVDSLFFCFTRVTGSREHSSGVGVLNVEVIHGNRVLIISIFRYV
jgi:hypothetical protein